jgi:hypothetical protein
MSGVDPYAYMQQVALRMNDLQARDEIETVLDELEYLFEVIPPDFQDPAEELIRQLRDKLEHAA